MVPRSPAGVVKKNCDFSGLIASAGKTGGFCPVWLALYCEIFHTAYAVAFVKLSLLTKAGGTPMISIRNINPMVRAVGTMGAVAALAGGVTFAALSSNSVVLADNTLDSATATLAIGAGSSCASNTKVSTPGFDHAALVPGEATDPVEFCLKNAGDVPLDITASVTNDTSPEGSIDPAKVTLDFDCNDGDETLSATLAELKATGTPQMLGEDSLGMTGQWDCTVTATLDDSVTDGGSVGPFDISFVGTEPTETTPTPPTPSPAPTPPVTTPTNPDEGSNG
jgi:hypothetical protein